MRLTKIHIENYGKIKDFDKTFESGINEIFEKNGFGKTTLASFIKAMFYGLAPVRSNGKDFNDRRKFYPFSGGKFGGNVEFDFGGDRYRIERFFGKKSDTDDEIAVYKNGDKTDELSPVPGLKLFGLDEESFCRTLFIDSEISEITSTGTINGLIGEFSADENGMGAADALSRLETARKKYKAAKGNNDLISAEQSEISELKTKIENIEKEGEALADYYSEYNKLTETERELSLKLKKLSAKNIEEEKRKTYDNLKSSAEAKLAELRIYAEKYPRGIPEKSEITRAEELLTEAESLALKRESAEFSFGKKTRLQSLARVFAGGKPSAEAFLKLQRTANEVSALRAEVESLKIGASDRERELEKKFGSADVPKVLLKLESVAAVYREKEEIARRASAAEAPIVEKNKKLPIAPFILFAVMIIAGAATAFAFKNLTAAIIGLALCAAGVIGGAITFFLSYGKNKTAETSGAAYEKAASARAEADSATEEMREIIVPFGYYSKNGVMFDYAKFRSDAEEYVKLKESSFERERAITEKTERAARAEESVKKFLSRFSIDASGETLQSGVYELKSLAEEYSRLSGEQAESMRISKAYADKESVDRKELNALFSRYGLLVNGNEKTLLKNIEADLSDILRLKKECADLRKKAEDYRIENSIREADPKEENAESADEISARLNECRKNLAVKRSEISASESVYETLADNKNRLEAAEERLKEYKEKRNVIALAEVFLKAADDKLQQKYAEPIRNSFVKYMAPLEKALGEKIIMDKDFKMHFESGGEIRDDKHLSSGQRCILSLCFRLSLIENAFESEKPFLIMDDPFVNLDEEHIERVVNFIKEIAKSEQIIYLCCHESRKML